MTREEMKQIKRGDTLRYHGRRLNVIAVFPSHYLMNYLIICDDYFFGEGLRETMNCENCNEFELIKEN